MELLKLIEECGAEFVKLSREHGGKNKNTWWKAQARIRPREGQKDIKFKALTPVEALQGLVTALKVSKTHTPHYPSETEE